MGYKHPETCGCPSCWESPFEKFDKKEKTYAMESICGEKVESCANCFHAGRCDMQDSLDSED